MLVERRRKLKGYEMMVLLDPDLEDPKGAVEKLGEILSAVGAEGVNVSFWGRRRLAYPVRKKSDGVYAVFDFSLYPDQVHELDRRVKLREEVMRHIIVCQDE